MENQADHWRDFRKEFEELAREEQGREIVVTKGKALRSMDHLLISYCDYNKHPEVLAEKGKPEQGFFCLLKVPETGLWMLSDGVSENFQSRFRTLTARAGLAFGCPKSTDPEDFWLHRLYLDLRENNSDLLVAASENGGMILGVCVASATFCSRLEKKALETSESVPKQLLERPARPPATIILTEREENIWTIIQRGPKGRLYCRELDGAGIKIRKVGIWKGALPTYTAAYDADKPWRHRIENEKSKIKQKAKLAKLAPELAGE